MKPGPELDLLVAEKVMKLKVTNYGNDVYYATMSGRCSKLCKDHGHLIPYYSTEIAEAWAVVEKLKGTNDVGIWGPHRRFKDEDNRKWECEFTNKTTRAWWNGQGDTAPHAICLAALKAMGVEV